MTEAWQPVDGRKNTTRQASLAAGETDQSVDEETKLTQWREELYLFSAEAEQPCGRLGIVASTLFVRITSHRATCYVS